ncbi:type I restriction enzyme S subunit [Lachnospiraceae bacterium PF1-21]
MDIKKAKEPAIRFKGFTGNWEQRKAIEIAEYFKGNGYSKSDLKEAGMPLILYGRLYTNYQFIISEVDTFAATKRGSVISQGNEVIIPASGESAEDIARASAVEKTGVLLGGDLNILRPIEQISPSFLALAFSSGNPKKELAKRAQGKSVVHIHNSDIQDVMISYPIKDEQNRIVDVFCNLDTLITLHQRELDLMKQQKRSLLSKMFPKNGTEFPELRFIGFANPWEQRKLGELVEQVIREVPKPEGSYYRMSVRSHAKGTFRQFVDDPQKVAMDKLFVVRENDLVVNITFAWEHAIAVVPPENDGLLVSHRFPTYRADGISDIDFLRYLVAREDFRRKLEYISPGGAGRNRILNKKEFLNLKVIVPETTSEQKIIGRILNKIDNLITLHQRKLETLKSIKKSFLAKMFV